MGDEGADVVRNYGEELRDAAMRNGISRDNSWFLDAEKKIASGEMNINAYTERSGTRLCLGSRSLVSS